MPKAEKQNYTVMHFAEHRARTCVCILSKCDYLHHWKTGEDAIGNKWRAIADDFGSIVYVEIKPVKRLHFNAYERQ